MSDPTFSPDGKWMWNGTEWIPSPPISNPVLQHEINPNQQIPPQTNMWVDFDDSSQSSARISQSFLNKKMFAITTTILLAIAGSYWYFIIVNPEVEIIEWEFSVTTVDGILESNESENIVYAGLTMIKGQDIVFEDWDVEEYNGFSIDMTPSGQSKVSCHQDKLILCTINNNRGDTDADGIPDEIDTDDDNDGIPDENDWVMDGASAGKIWQVGETLSLSENFGENYPHRQICYEESYNCEIEIRITIDMDTDCSGWECNKIDPNYPKTFKFTINILGPAD